MRSQCTILFEEPFWIGIFEIWEDGAYYVCRIVFGKEPKSSEIYEWMLAYYAKLHFKQANLEEETLIKKVSPKKLKKQIIRQVSGKYQGTKAQQALKSMHEETKEIRRKRSRAEKEAALERKFELRQEKKKQKKRGH